MTYSQMIVVALAGILINLSPPAAASLHSECSYDVEKVYRARIQGIPKEKLHEILARSPEIGDERRAFILELIEDAYSRSAKDFADDAFPRCGQKT